MAKEDQIVAALGTVKSSMRHINRRSMRLGRYVGGVLEERVNNDLPANYVWVFDPQGDKRVSSPAKNLKTEYGVGLAVIVAYNIDTLEDDVIDVDTVLAPLEQGSAAAGLNSPQKPAGLPTPISARDITVGGVFADSGGGLNVRLGAFWHENGYYADSTALTLVPTVTSGQKSLAVVGVNRLTKAATYTLTANRGSAYTLIANGAPTTDAVSDIMAVVDANPHIDWRGAVELKNGDTEVNPAKIIPLNWLKPAMIGADGATAGERGLVPAPAATDNVKALFGDGSYYSVIKADGSIAMTGALNFNGQDANAVNWLNFDDSTELTISAGAITATQTFHRVDTEADAAADDLDTINGGSDGRILVLRAENGGRSVVLKHNTGNIQTYSGTDVTLSETYMPVLLVYDGTLSKWLAFGGGGGGVSSGNPAFGSGVIKTLASDVASAGSDRHLIIAAETGTADNLIEITGLNAGDEVILRADSGDTITVKHNDAGATDKIILYGAADMVLSGDKTVKLFKSASGKVVQYVDDSTTGSAPSTGKYLTYAYDSTNTAEKAIPAWEFHPDIEPASPNAADDEFAGSSLDGDWSWVNQGSSSAAVAKSRLLLTVPSTSTGNVRGIFRTYPGQSTWEAQITGWSSLPVFSGANNYILAIARRDSSSGKLETYGVGWDSATAALYIRADRWTNTTTYSAGIGTNVQLGRITFHQFYIRLVDDNTNILLSWSLDGVNYMQWASQARAAFLASADQIGLAVFTQQTSGNIYLQSDWMRRTA